MLVFNYFAGTLSILGTWVILAAAFVGIGLGARRLFGLRTVGIDDCFHAFWVGFGGVILFLILWNFIYPITGITLLCFLVVGSVGLFAARRPLGKIRRNDPWNPTRSFILLAILASLWIANLSTGPFISWDGGLYHLQTVKWASSYAVVPGIANLHGSLAYNNSNFLYAAMLDSGMWKGRAFHVSNGLLVWVLLLQALVSGSRLRNTARRTDTRDLFNFLLLAPAFHGALRGEASSYSSDLPTTMVLLAAASSVYSSLVANRKDPAESAYAVFSAFVLLATVVCLKISVGVFSVIAAPLVLFCWLARRPSDDGLLTKTIGWTLGISIVFAAGWMGRGVIMSGYPLFPCPIGGFPVEWRSPLEHAAGEVANIAYTEREFAWRIGRGWFKELLLNNPFAVFIPSCVAVFATAVGCCLARSRGGVHLPAACTRALWMLIPVGVAITVWFVVVPSVRYAVPLFWTLAALSVCLSYSVLTDSQSKFVMPMVVAGSVCLGIAPPVAGPIVEAAISGTNPARAALEANFIKPHSGRWFHPIAEQSELTTFTASSGLTVYVPKKPSSGPRRAKCWDAPLPCTPNPAVNLRLRQPGRLDKGFKVDGPWQMQDWPYYWRTKFRREYREKTK